MGAIYGSSYYAIVDGPTWLEASSRAEALGGYLAAINDFQENNFVKDFLETNNIYNSAFIGFRNGSWADGSSLGYNNFHPDIKSNQNYYF